MVSIGWINLENIMLSGTSQAQKEHAQDSLRWNVSENQIQRDRKQNHGEYGGKMGKDQESWKEPMTG